MKPSLVRARYDNEAKDIAREIVVTLGKSRNVESVLDLGGAGGSARRFREALPDAAVVVAETDQQLWPALRLDAQQSGYVFSPGDFRLAAGRYDLIWLDLCAQWCASTRDAVKAAARMVSDDGMLFVTLMAAREVPEIATERFTLVPLSLELATGLAVRVLYPYQTGAPMWLVGLADRRSSPRWHAHDALEEIEDVGWFNYLDSSLSLDDQQRLTCAVLESKGRPEDAARFRKAIARIRQRQARWATKVAA